ncbi:MAG TPA: glutamyl-tRNA reductase [Anaerolineales bacterium]
MHIVAIGVSHTACPLHLRERLALHEEQIRTAFALLSHGERSQGLAEAIILSTCNRIEVYTVSSEVDFSGLEIVLSESSGVPREQFSEYVEHRANLDAVHHLFRVAAGLESLVLGEAQILGQVVRALELARGQHMAGGVLNRLFQAAIHAGKRARTETGIGRHPASVSSLAASLAGRSMQSVTEAQILVLGAGEMAELAVEALRKRGVSQVTVLNRTLERAQGLAARWNARVATADGLEAAIAAADIVIASTGAPQFIVTKEHVAQAMQRRPQRPLLLIDIAVPRDIDPEVAHISHVKLYDIDGLSAQLEASLESRSAEVPQVEAILQEELASVERFLRSLNLLPIIAEIHKQAETIRAVELERTLRRMPDLTDAERKRIDAMTRALVKRLLHAPTHRLRSEAGSPLATEYAAVARALFDPFAQPLDSSGGNETQPSLNRLRLEDGAYDTP